MPRVQLRQKAPVVLGKRPGEANRNLALGICAVLLATPLAGLAFVWAPRETFVAAATGMLLALVIFLAFQLHLLLQRNGTFLLLASGLLVTLAVPVCVRLGSTGMDWMTDVSELRAARAGQPAENGGVPVFVQGAGRGVQGQAGAPRQGGASSPGEQPANVVAVSPAVAPSPGPAAPATETLSPESAKRAEQALLEQLLAKLSVEDPQIATRMAQKEMQRRYPALEDPSSKEANQYREAYNELGRLRKYEFFKDPAWPLKIAEMLAAREGWKRADLTPVTPAPTGGPLPATAAPRPSEQRDQRDQREQRPPGAEASPAVLSAEAGPQPLPGEELALDGPGVTPAADSHAQEVKRSMIEARSRYPGIGIEGSEENKAYLEVYQELDKLRPDFFTKGDWPIRLVELVAKREGWKRSAEPKVQPSAGAADLPLPR